MRKLIQKFLLCLSLLTMNTSFLIGMAFLRGPRPRKPVVMTPDTSLIYAIQIGQIETVKQALKNGANPNFVDNFDRTPLDIALDTIGKVYGANDKKILFQIIELLLQSNAHVNAIDDNGKTPLETELEAGSPEPEIIKLLLAYGATMPGSEILNLANPEAKKLLKDYVDLLERVKSTDPATLREALREAIENDYHLLVLDLIRRGVQVNVDAKDGDLQLAKTHGSKRSGRIILKQLKLTCPVGSISKTGLQTTGLPTEILEEIARFAH